MTAPSPPTRAPSAGHLQSGQDDQPRLVWQTYWPPATAHRAQGYLALFLQAARAADITVPERFTFQAGQVFFQDAQLQEVRLRGHIHGETWSTPMPPKLLETAEKTCLLDIHDAGRDHLSARVIEEAPGCHGVALAWDVRVHGERFLALLAAQPPALPATSPSLFPSKKAHAMASSLVVWEGSNILTRGTDLPWQPDAEGKLAYARTVYGGKGKIVFWVTDDPEAQHPETLAREAALAVLETFDIRAACMHLVYAAHVMALERPWADEFVIDDRQIIRYLGLEKRTDLRRQDKLALIATIARQPAQLRVYLYWPPRGKRGEFALEQSRLWDVAITAHGQQDLEGGIYGTGLTIRGRAGLWAKYFLNRSGRKEKSALYEYGYLPHTLLKTVTSCWQKHAGAARLLIWLVFKTRVGRDQPIAAVTLLEIAYGKATVEAAQRDRRLRNSVMTRWDGDLFILHQDGWRIRFDAETYPHELWPSWAGRPTLERPAGYWEQLRQASLVIAPPSDIEASLAALDERKSPQRPSITRSVPPTKEDIRTARVAHGWTQNDLATALGKSRPWVTLVESGARRVHPKDFPRLRKILQL